MSIDITFQLMHGLKCMSRHAHITLIYMEHGDRQWHIALHLCASTSHEMGVSAWKINIVFGVDVGFRLRTKS